MPHAELKYSADLDIDPTAILAAIEQTILRHDSGSGPCKGRAYPAAQFNHTHLLLAVTMLRKPHRDTDFTDRLMEDLESTIKTMIGQSCHFSFSLDYSTGHYVTNRHEVVR